MSKMCKICSNDDNHNCNKENENYQLVKEIFKLNNEVLLIGKQVKELNDKNNFDLSIINFWKINLKAEIY